MEGQFKKKEARFEQVSASLSGKFTCQEYWNYLELDGVNICARQMLGQGGVAGVSKPPPSPLYCLQMLHGMPDEGWCNPTYSPTHILLQGDPSKHTKLPRRGDWNSGDLPWQLAGCKFPLGEYWSNWAQQHRIGFGVTPHTHISCPPLLLPVIGSRNFGVLWSLFITFRATTEQHFQTFSCSSPQLPKPTCSYLK